MCDKSKAFDEDCVFMSFNFASSRLHCKPDFKYAPFVFAVSSSAAVQIWSFNSRDFFFLSSLVDISKLSTRLIINMSTSAL